jgi:hypothetical protein
VSPATALAGVLLQAACGTNEVHTMSSRCPAWQPVRACGEVRAASDGHARRFRPQLRSHAIRGAATFMTVLSIAPALDQLVIEAH